MLTVRLMEKCGKICIRGVKGLILQKEKSEMVYKIIKEMALAGWLTAMATAMLTACAGNNASAGAARTVAVEELNTVEVSADSLYRHVERQVELGPRIPGSSAHAKCVEMISGYLTECGVDTVSIHRAPVTTFKGEKFTAENIFGQINPAATRRILLLAHYDTRPWADHDPDPASRSTPIDGANDGGSGTAVLMEVARVLAPALPDSIGVDLLFTDLEDSGESGDDDTEGSWCLGTQEWVKQIPYTSANRPAFAILLDMVGGAGAQFHREYFSHRHASPIVDKVWNIARRSGFGETFVNTVGGAIVDDHIFINRAGIPCIDIIESLNEHTGSFNPTWHTTADTLAAIDRASLRAAAQTVVNTILN